MTARIALAALLSVGALAVFTSVAVADGDPASDVLVTQPLFLPADAGATAQQQAELGGLLTEAARAGYPLRVALIASASDLGSVTPLWREPRAYAQFLGEELSLVFKGTLLVVMPNGFGLDRTGGPALVNPDVLSASSVAGSGSRLAPAAFAAVQRLAAAAGHPLSVRVAAAHPYVGPSASDAIAWIVLLLGGCLIGVAWVVSLRMQPVGAKPRRRAHA